MIDLSNDLTNDASVRQNLASEIVAAGLDPVVEPGASDALAGVNVDKDALQLASALDEAKRMFGELDCTRATAAADTAIGIASARQAAGLPVPELPRAWAYVLLCADRSGEGDLAFQAASSLRALGAGEVDATVLARYPEVDTLAGRDMIDVDIKADVPGAAIWVDARRVGVSPIHLVLTGGRHVIAAASGTKRGLVSGTVVKAQPVIAIPMIDEAGPWSRLATRVASWHGKVPSPSDLAAVFDEVGVRIAVVRHGDVLEVWGRIGRSEQPHVLGGDDRRATVADARRVMSLIADRLHGWNDHAPDPDQPLLVEAPNDKFSRAASTHVSKQEPTQWWVYASIIGAIAAGAVVIVAHDSAQDTQRVELHYP